MISEEQPEGTRYWVSLDTDYYATFDYAVYDGLRSAYVLVAGFNTEYAAQSYADYLNEQGRT